MSNYYLEQLEKEAGCADCKKAARFTGGEGCPCYKYLSLRVNNVSTT